MTPDDATRDPRPADAAAPARRIGIFGLGEAGSLFAADLAAGGARVRAFDPAPVATPAGVDRRTAPAEAVEDAEIVLALVAEADMATAVSQAAGAIPPGACYADLGAGSPGRKRELAAVAERHGFSFVDVGLMAIVPGNGAATPALAAGDAAERFVAAMAPLGMRVEAIPGGPGAAAARKLLRSVVTKGLSALVLEALRGAEAAGCRDWLWDNVCHQITTADEAFLVRLVEGTRAHSRRRTDEMAASASMLAELGVDPRMTRSTVELLRAVPDEGLPEIG